METVAEHPSSSDPPEVIRSPLRPRGPSKQQLAKLYELPAPLRTFPLPTLVPHNPLSLLQIVFSWLSQVIKPPSSHPKTLYQGIFSPDTRSVHVLDHRSIRALWEQGFYGKGSLSRSEPNWLDTQKARRGTPNKMTSEEVTRKRRTERQQSKWERARKEREVIEQTLLQETAGARAATENHSMPNADPRLEEEQNGSANASVQAISKIQDRLFSRSDSIKPGSWHPQIQNASALDNPATPCWMNNDVAAWKLVRAPVGPLELLALPNSLGDISIPSLGDQNHEVHEAQNSNYSLVADSTCAESEPMAATEIDRGGVGPSIGPEFDELRFTIAKPRGLKNQSPVTGDGMARNTDNDSDRLAKVPSKCSAHGLPEVPRPKSVRFCPEVENNTFVHSEPPSPAVSMLSQVNEIAEQEHFQLTLEEAFFLSYGLGALQILDPITKHHISNKSLLLRFREHLTSPPALSHRTWPDDTFLIHYAVYHHFRSLGWVVRGGVKFSVDYLLYNRGPVFTHAEFAVIIMRSYSDSFWKSVARTSSCSTIGGEKSWSWLHCINRVITQVKKTLVLVYVDVPPPLDEAQEDRLGIDELLQRYRIREVMLKRWSPNRSRD